MLKHFFHTPLSLGLAQAVIVATTAIIVAQFAGRLGGPSKRGPKVGKGIASDLPFALLRGLVQILAVGAILAVLLKGPWWSAIPILIAMIVAAAATVRSRVRRIPRVFTLSLVCFFCGAGLTITVMTALGIIDTHIRMLIPVGSMVIAQSMNIQALFFNRFLGEITSHTGEIDSALALGASPSVAVGPYLRVAFRASLIPATDNLRALGIVWIPGIMAGMVLSGDSPLYAALYQFVVLAMVFTSGGLNCLAAVRLLPARVFTANEQLILRG